MKTLSLALCVLLAAYGMYAFLFEANDAGSVPAIIGALAFMIISRKTEKIAGYNPNHWMNR